METDILRTSLVAFMNDNIHSTNKNNNLSTTKTLPPSSSSSSSKVSPTVTMAEQPTTIKMENFQQSPDSLSATPPATEAKPAKKRKSWGQVLPEPKTNLPPRKRAKTADEKEQRRIERVKRNRLAAHNSRERKRQEVEHLQAEKDELEMRLQNIRDHVKLMTAELRSYRETGAPLEGQTPVDLNTVEELFSKIPNFLNNPSHLQSAHPSDDTVNPRQTSFPSPESMTLDSMDSPFDTISQPSTPTGELMMSESDRTQHSAAMLCDLQCQSDSPKHLSASTSVLQTRSACNSMIALLLLFNIQLSLTTIYSAISSTLLRSWTATLPSWNNSRTPSSPLPSTLIRLATLFQLQRTSLTGLVESSSNCTPTQAQHPLCATSLALQRSSDTNSLLRLLLANWVSGVDGVDGFSDDVVLGIPGRRSPTELSEVQDEVKRSCHALDAHVGTRLADGHGRQKAFAGLSITGVSGGGLTVM